MSCDSAQAEALCARLDGILKRARAAALRGRERADRASATLRAAQSGATAICERTERICTSSKAFTRDGR